MLAAAAFGQTASAQAPMSPLDGAFPPVAPPPTGYPAQPTYTPIAPDAASPAGYPPSMEPWPTISPYDHAVDTTYNDRGIWFREMLNHERKYKINAEFISARFRQPGNGSIGADQAIANGERGGVDPFNIYGVKDDIVYSGRGRYFFEADGTLEIPNPIAQEGELPRSPNLFIESEGMEGEDADGVTNDFTFALPKAGLLQVVNVHLDDPDLGIDDGIDDTDDDDDEVSDTVLYPVTGQVFGDDAVYRFGGDPGVVGEKHVNSASPGLRLTFGLEDEDGSGFDWTGWWLDGQANTFRRGLDDPDRQRLTNIVFFDAPWLGQGAVEYLDYNTLFEVSHETEAAQTDLAFYHTPMVDYGWFRMRPLYGARYNYIRETFKFTGRDNGFAAVYAPDGTPGSSTTTTNIVPLVLDEVDDQFILSFLNPYETTALSKVRSHLYGPQLGFDMQAGGEHLMLTAVTKAGVLANTEKLSLDTTGFGTSEALTGVRSFKSDAKTHTRIVPFLEFNANADINVFPVIPVVNRWQFLKNARVRAGWTTLVVGSMQRPLDQIVWRSDTSGGAYIKEKGRDAWYTQYWNLGVHWTF